MNTFKIIALVVIACCLAELASSDVMVGDALENYGDDQPQERSKRQTSTSGYTFKVDSTKKGFTSAEKSNIIKKHNAIRAGVSPKAGNMRYMAWHDTLAAMAQTWTNACKFAHGQPATPTAPYSWVGQNLFAGTGGYNESFAIQTWANEVSNFNYASNTCATGKVCGHYTQVVWANTNRVGCGITLCPTLTGTTMTNAYFIACNYGPGGNYVGQAPYTSGATSCSSCPTDAPKCTNSLCAPTTLTSLCTSSTCTNYAADTCVCP